MTFEYEALTASLADIVGQALNVGWIFLELGGKVASRSVGVLDALGVEERVVVRLDLRGEVDALARKCPVAPPRVYTTSPEQQRQHSQ